MSNPQGLASPPSSNASTSPSVAVISNPEVLVSPSSSNASTSDSNSDVFSSKEHYHREPFREGAPAPLCYRPGIVGAIRPSNRLVAEWKTVLRPKVLSAMDKYRIFPRSIGVIHRRDVFWPLLRPDETVQIDAPSQHHVGDNWYLAVSEIRQFCMTVGWPELILDILDCTEFGKYTWAIKPHEPIVKQWPQVRDVLLEQLECDEASDLESINVFRRGKSEDRLECAVTIVLTAPELYGLMKIKDRIREQLDINGYGHIDLELIRDRIFRGFDIDPLDPKCYQATVGMGASIGLQNRDESGTMGGYVNLRGSWGQVQLGLTCYHVIRAGLTSSQMEYSDAKGISPSSTLGRNLILTHPSETDHKSFTEAQKKRITDCEEELVTYKSKLRDIEMKIKMGLKPEGYDESYRKVVEHLESQIEKTRHLLKSDQELFLNNSDFGHVFAASGFRRSSEDNQLDWALIVPTRPINTDIPTHDDKGERLSISNTLLEASKPPTLGQRVWKKGRRTGITRGIINSIQSDVLMDKRPQSRPSTEWAITHEGGTGYLFAEKGDSGSIIVNLAGEMTGLLIGGAVATGFVFMTPYATLVSDIENITGGTLIL